MSTMNDLDYIDSYFKGQLEAGEIKVFEQRITGDHSFADQVAFYISTHETARDLLAEDKKQRFRELYVKQDKPVAKVPVRKLWRYVAAAAIITGIVMAGELLLIGGSTSKLVNRYIQSEFETIGINMGGLQDSIQTGIQMYNDRKWTEALQQFENVVHWDTAAWEARKYAGIVSLRLGLYDKALSYFKELGSYTLSSNPSLLYQAITLIKRNNPGDLETARQLLLQVEQKNLSGKEKAKQWLKTWND